MEWYESMKALINQTSWKLALHGALILSWLPVKEADLQGYKLYYGNQSRRYDHVVFVGSDTTYTLGNLESGKHYYLAITALDVHGNESDYSNEITAYIPSDKTPYEQLLSMKSYNYPNPFHPDREVTHIRYFLKEASVVSIDMLDHSGKKIVTILNNGHKSPGEHSEDIWDGRGANRQFVQNGVYYCRIQNGKDRTVIPIVVIR